MSRWFGVLTALLLVPSLCAAQAQPTNVWQRTFGGNQFDSAQFVQQTHDGGYFVAGVKRSFGFGRDDFYVLKLDQSGKKLWDKTYGGMYEDYPVSGQQTSDGGFIVVGMTSSFGAGGWDAYIVKLDSNGNKFWEKTFGGTNDDLIGRVVRTHNGGYVLVGWTKSFGTGGSDVYIVKLDRDGSRQWERTYGGDRDDQAWSVQQTNEGGYIVAGWTKSSERAWMAMS